jgi:hypothetical protein
MLTRILARDLIHRLGLALVISAFLFAAYKLLPANHILLAIVLIPLVITFILALPNIISRARSNDANIAAITKILEDMEANGQISSTQKRMLWGTLLGNYPSEMESSEAEYIGRSIRRHKDSLSSNIIDKHAQ